MGRKISSVLLGIILYLALTLGMIIFVFLHTVGSPQFFRKVITQSRVAHILLKEAPTLLVQYVNQGSGKQLISSADIATIVQNTMTAGFVESTVSDGLRAVFDVVSGKTAQVHWQVDLISTKANLVQAVDNLAKQKAAALPICATAAQIAASQQDLSCRPPQTSVAEVEAMVRAAASEFVNTFPAQYDAGAYLNKNSQMLGKIASIYKKILLGWWLALGLILFLVLLLLAVNRKHPATFFRYVGYPILLVGVPAFLVSVLLKNFAISIFFNQLVQLNLQKELQVVANSLISAATQIGFGFTTYAAAGLIVAGFAIIIIAGSIYHHELFTGKKDQTN